MKITIILFFVGLTNLMISQVLYPIERRGNVEELFDSNKKGGYSGFKNLSGYVDIKGKQIVSYKYDDAEHFSDGLGKVNLNDKYGFVDHQGKEVIQCQFDQATSFKNGFAWVTKNGIEFLIDKQLNKYEIDNVLYENKKQVFPSEGMIRIKVNGKVGFVNLANELMILAEYDEAHPFANNVAVAKKGNNYFLLTKDGFEKPIPYKDCHSVFVDGKLAVQNEQGKWGLINENLELNSLCTFDNKYTCIGIKNYESEYVMIKDEKGYKRYYYGLKDETGKQLLENKYLSKLKVCEDRIVCFEKDYSLTILDINLNVIKKFKKIEEGVTRDYYYQNGACLIHTYNELGVVSKYVDKQGIVFWTSHPWYSCFPVDSRVVMSDFSYKPIQNINEGEEIMSFDISEKSYTSTKVKAVEKHEGDYLQIKIIFEVSNNQYASISDFGVENNQLKVTPNHPLLTQSGIVTAGNLKNGDVLYVWNGTTKTFDQRKITSICEELSAKTVYNLKTDRNTYLVEDVVVMVK